jgi:ATP-dependent Clp protease ATP-binding subunit ClpA
MFERFTHPARTVVVGAQREARSLGHQVIQPVHLLLGLADGDGDIAATVLRGAGIDPGRVRADVQRQAGDAGPLGPNDAEALQAIGIDLDAVRIKIEEAFGPGALEEPLPARRRRWPFRGQDGRGQQSRGPGAGSDSHHIPFAPSTKKVLELSVREAMRLGQGHIGTEHLLLGLLREGDGQVAAILSAAGLTVEGLRAQVRSALGEAA